MDASELTDEMVEWQLTNELMESASLGDLERVQELVEMGVAFAGISEGQWQSPLYRAVGGGHMDVVEYLVEIGADVNAADVYTQASPLMSAVEAGNNRLVKFLIDHGADVNAVRSGGESALTIASGIGLLDVVQCLVEHGADCNAATVFGDTALMQAAKSGVLAVIQVLLDNGARINDTTAQGTALSIAASASPEDIVRMLIDRGADVFACSPLLRAASSGRLDVMQRLIDAGVDMKKPNEDGYTALFCATSARRLHVVRYLLDHGADINARTTFDKRTALYEASQGGNLDVVRLLCENGADLNAADRFEWTPLMVAAANGRIDVVKYLVECGADLNAESDQKWNVLACATASRNFDIVKYLVEVGTDVDAADSDGWTALMHASSTGQTDVVEYLASRVSDMEIVNSAGHTAMDIATETDHLDVQRILMRYTPSSQNKLTATIGIGATSPSFASPWFISPFDVRIKKFVQTGHVGGEFIAKWLDADVVIKLFVPAIANGDFKTELTTWHKLRHPNVIKLYGACDVVYNFFVCEYASNGSVVDHLSVHEPVRQTPWKFLHQAAMGLAYLHERKIVHGNLRGSNILVGSDGLAKLADFGLSGSVGRELDVASQGSSVSSTRWQPPEQIRGGKPSTASDMYSFGLCIGEVLTLTIPWGKECTYPDESKQQWDLREASQLNPMPPFFFWEDTPSRKAEDFIELLCGCDPTKRATIIACLPILESLATEEQSQLIACDEMQQPEAEPIISVYEFQEGELMKVWTDVQVLAQNEDLREIHKQLYQDLNLIMQKLVESSHSYKLLAQTSELLTNIRRTIQPGSHIAQVLQLSSSRVTGSSMFAFQRRIDGIKNQIGLPAINDDVQLTQQKLDHPAKQLELFVSETSKTWMVLNELVTQEDRQAFLLFLQSEMGNPEGQYTNGQLETIQQAYSEIKDSISNNSEGNPQFDSTLPEWFVPWYELPVTEWETLGQGGFAQVFRAKWLDSDVVVKRIEYASESTSSASTEREDARKMFMREVDIWFRLSHPNVVRLFGACHIGKPFFVCEFAEFGSLDEYLVSHQKELWQKLLEAALGILYLHERGIVHCDLKCNNIVVGSDCKAKVTDFGLSSAATTDAVGDGNGHITGAWHWVAPELLMQEHAPPTFSSDVYAFGMCIIEAVKVIEASEDHSGNPPSTLPWSIRSTTLPNAAVKAHKKRGKLPSRPKFMSDLEWELIEKMCRFNANERVQMCTVVEELSVFAQQEGRGEHNVGTNMKAGEVSRDEITEETGGDSRSAVASMMALVNRYKSSSIDDSKLMSPRIVLYDVHELLWKRLSDVYKRVKDNAKALARLEPLIDNAQAVTIILETYADTLVESTKVALDSFALHRELDKLMAAEFILLDNQDEGVHKWRQACYHVLGVSEAL